MTNNEFSVVEICSTSSIRITINSILNCIIIIYYCLLSWMTTETDPLPKELNWFITHNIKC